MSDNQSGMNGPQAFNQQMQNRIGGSGPWWQNTFNSMRPLMQQQQSLQGQMPQYTPGAPMRAGQPMAFNPALLQSSASGPQIPQVPVPQVPQAPVQQPMPAFGFSSAPPSTQQFVQNWQAQKAAEEYAKTHGDPSKVSYGALADSGA